MSTSNTKETDNAAQLSKKAAKKAEKQAAKEAKKAAAQQAVTTVPDVTVESIESQCYGRLPLVQSSQKTNRTWTRLQDVTEESVGQVIWVRCRVQESRCKGGLGFLVLRQRADTIQAVLDSRGEGLGREAIKWAASIPLESIVDVLGTITKPAAPIIATSLRNTEILIQKLFCVSKSAPELPFQLKDANRPDNATEIEEGAITVGQDIRLDNRILDLRTLANQSIFAIQSTVGQLFREYLYGQGFIEIHTPKLISGAAEGGANVFKLDYFNNLACLAQSPQLHKQMTICADFDRVFEVCPVFRAENSNTHRHLCEFTGLDVEMAIKEHYDEVLDVLDELFRYIFRGLTERCAKHIQQVHRQHPAKPFIWSDTTPRIPFMEGIQMLRDAGYTSIPDDVSSFDLSTELEKALGRLVREKYNTDFYMLVRYPLGVRPFYTMPCADDPKLSNSYDFFMRGEEIVSGAQRVHDPGFLVERAKACGVQVESIQSYVDSFKLGAYPHGGCGIGLERVVMLFLGLGNIRKTSLFPRDPKRLAP